MKPTVLTRAKSQMVLQDPFYATILLNLAVVECKKTPDGRDLWMAATNGTELFINPENFETLSVAEAKGVLKHEVMHIAQLHPWRLGDKEHRRWNMATDYAINPMILEEGGELPKGALDGTPYKGQTADKIYGQLPPMPPGSGGNSGRQRGNGQNPMDDDVMPAKDKSQAGVEKAKVMISQAASVAKARGKLPKAMQEAIDEILSPKVDWKEQLRQFLTEHTPSDYSFARPNRRFIAGDAPMYLPSMFGHDAMRGLGVILDTSGSITMEELQQGLGEIVGAVTDVSPQRLVVAYCDAKVQHSDVFDQPTDASVAATFKRHGSGGTSMPAGLKWFNRNHPDVQAVIVWTDGETDWGNEHDFGFPVLWAITSDRYTAPWGTTVHVDLD